MNVLNRINLTVIGLLFAVFSLVAVTSTQVFAEEPSAQDAVCESLGSVSEGDDCAGGGENVSNVLETVLNLLSFVAGVIAVIMMIIAGIKFITSQGDAQKVASARNSIIYALVGVVIVVISQAVVIFVISRASEQTTSQNSIAQRNV